MSRSETEVDSGRKEEKVLFLELGGELVGINLKNQHGTCNLQCSQPPIAPICCRIPLHKKGYPLGMRHFKSPIDDKLYLLGGALFDPNRGRLGGFDRYSKDVYEFKVDLVVGTADKDTTIPFVLSPDDVLRHVNHPLSQPKFALVANLKGTIYALHHHAIPNAIPGRKPDNYKHTFECFDAFDKTWHDAPVPSFYLRHDEIDWPVWGIPRECLILHHFVVDAKFLLFCRDGLLHIFDHDTQTWLIETKEARRSIALSFAKFDPIPPYIPNTGLWLSKFPDDDPNSLGVMLAIHIAVDSYCYGLAFGDIPSHHRDLGIDHLYSWTYKASAFSMSKTECQAESCQALDEVFSGMLHAPLRAVAHHLVDLGNDDAHGNRRRICAILTGDDLDGIPYLFISIFDLQLRVNPSNSSDFLEVSIVKKLVFGLNNDPSIQAYDNNESWRVSYDIPPLDAFIV